MIMLKAITLKTAVIDVKKHKAKNVTAVTTQIMSPAPIGSSTSS